MNSADKLKITDTIPFLRRNPGMFFRAGQPNTAELIERVETYIVQGGFELEIQQQGDLIMVRTEQDWMQTGAPVTTLFEGLHPTPDRGLNTDRPEVFVAAFSRAWGSDGDAGSAFSEPDEDVARTLSTMDSKWRRVLVWKAL